jgi:hypothetical protein
VKAVAQKHPAPPDKVADGFVKTVLDDLEVAERAYHHLDFSRPLVTALVSRARRLVEPGDRVLLVGGSTLLAECLLGLGFDLDVWQFPNAHMTQAAKARVTRTIQEDTLADIDMPEREFKLAVVPMVIEAMDDGGEALLRKLRKSLASDGVLIVATANQSRLDVRLAALRGRSMMSRKKGGEVSLGWPALSTRSHHQKGDLVAVARRAGYRVGHLSYAVAWQPFLHMELLSVHEYALRKFGQAVSSSVAPCRDVVIAELSSRYADQSEVKTENLTVSVFVSATRGGDPLRQTLDALGRQTYPDKLYEVVVLHDGSLPGVGDILADAASRGMRLREMWSPGGDGPMRRNLAMAEAKSDISAHTDDSSIPPPDWIEAALRWFDEETAVVTGPVFQLAGSEPRFFDVPGVRPDPGEKGIWSEVIYPACNVFYRTAVALAGGGFDAAFSSNGNGAAIGWDTELAWRIQRSGWQGRFREEVYQFRLFEGSTERAASLNDQARRASEIPLLAARAPEFAAGSFSAGVFASKQTMYFDLALVAAGAALIRRNPRYLLLTLPWLGEINPRLDLWPPSAWRGSAKTAAKIAARQVAWLSGFVRGSIKARRLVL